MGTRIVTLRGAGTDAADDDYAAIFSKSRIVAVYMTDADGITANDTNYMSFLLKAGTTTLFTRATTVAGTGFAAGTPQAGPSGAVGTVLAAGSKLHLDCNKSGTGPAYNMRCEVLIEEIQ